MQKLIELIKNKISSDFIWRLIQIYLKEGTVFFLFLLAVKILVPEQFGLYSYISSFVYFFILIGDFGVSATTSKLVAEKVEEDSASIGKIFTSSFLAIFLTSLVSLGLTLLIASFFLKDKMYLLYYIAPTILLAPVTSFFDGFYRGLKRFKLLSKLSIFSFIIFVVSSFYLILHYGLRGALFSQNIFYIIFLIGTFFIKKEINLKLDKAIIKEIISYSIVVGLGSVGYFLYTKIDVVILGKFGFFLQAAYYEVITKIFSVFIITFSIFGQVIAPYLIGIRKDKSELIRTTMRYRKQTILYAIATAALSIVFVPIGIYLFLPKYFNSTFLTGFGILAVLLPFDLWAVVQRQGILVPLGMARVVTVSTIVGGILNVISDIVLIKTIGFIGVFLSTFLIHAGVLIYQDRYMKKHISLIAIDSRGNEEITEFPDSSDLPDSLEEVEGI